MNKKYSVVPRLRKNKSHKVKRKNEKKWNVLTTGVQDPRGISHKKPDDSYQEMLTIHGTGKTSFFKSEIYKVFLSIPLLLLRMHTSIFIYDAGFGPSLFGLMFWDLLSWTVSADETCRKYEGPPTASQPCTKPSPSTSDLLICSLAVHSAWWTSFPYPYC